MTSQRRFPPLLVGVLIALCLLPGLSVVASMSWLKQQPDEVVFLLTGIAGFVTVLAALVLGFIQDRGMDEWQRSNARFSSFWGDALGSSLVALLICVAPFRAWVVSAVANFAGVANPDQTLVILAFVGGFMFLVMARILCVAALSTGWTLWKSRAAREPS